MQIWAQTSGLAVSKGLSSNTSRAVGGRPTKETAAQRLEDLLNEATRVYRVVIGEARRFPELAKHFYDNGPARVLTALTQYLEFHDRRGILEIADTTLAAAS